VTDAAAESTLGAARVAIVEGTNSGKSAVADSPGKYRLESLEPGTIALRITADGYDAESKSVTLTSDLTVDVALRKSTGPAPPPVPTATISGVAIDGVSDRALSGVTVHIPGVGDAVTGADGSFKLDVEAPEQERPVTLSSTSTNDRKTQLHVPGPPAKLTLMPSSLDLNAFDQMFRGGGSLVRWSTAPSIVVQTQVLQFTNINDQEFTATAATISDAEVAGLVADLTWALPQLTGTTFNGFASVQRETAAPGDRVRVARGNGEIVIARYVGLQAATTYWGYTRWMTTGGEVRGGVIMLDDGFETSGSAFRRSLRAHELGHALGYNHVTGRESVMNASARLEPNTFDRDGAKLAFSRPPLNRSPDIDPDPFTSNLRAPAQPVWHGSH
jgi:hypothetical protein